MKKENMDVRTVMTTKIMTQTNIRMGEMRSPRIFVFHIFSFYASGIYSQNI